jgi:hypothetical protein
VLVFQVREVSRIRSSRRTNKERYHEDNGCAIRLGAVAFSKWSETLMRSNGATIIWQRKSHINYTLLLSDATIDIDLMVMLYIKEEL